MTMETGMSRELKTEQELLELVVKALDANPATAGWIPTGFHETVDDEDGCNWDITHLHRDRKDADVRDAANSAAAAIINELGRRSRVGRESVRENFSTSAEPGSL
jgi:hypothetical protein